MFLHILFKIVFHTSNAQPPFQKATLPPPPGGGGAHHTLGTSGLRQCLYHKMTRGKMWTNIYTPGFNHFISLKTVCVLYPAATGMGSF
jgi:hypothetical protein